MIYQEREITSILADGNIVVVLFRQGKSEMAYVFKQYFLTEVSVDMPCDESDTIFVETGANYLCGPPQGIITLNMEVKIPPFDMVGNPNFEQMYSENGGLIFDLNLMDFATSEDLFKEVYKRIKKRSKKFKIGEKK